LADGNTPWPQIIRILKHNNFQGPVSFHSEYQGEHSFATLDPKQVVEQTARDMSVFQQWLDQADQENV
jgi:hypothetical protein